MSERLRRALKRHREEIAGEVAARLVNEPNADVGQEVARLRAVDTVLEALPVSRWRAALGPAAMALVCLAAVWAAWTITIDALGLRTGVVLTVDAATVNLLVDGDWEWNDRIQLADGRLRIERATLTFSDPSRAFATLPDDAFLDVEADSVTLQKLTLEPGTALTLERTDSEELTMYVTHGSAAGIVLVNGSTTLTWGETDGVVPETKQFPIEVAPERITFSAERPQGVPARIVFRPRGPLSLRDLKVSGLRFGREVAAVPGEPVFVSTVRDGRLQVPDVGVTYDLSIGYVVILHDLRGYIRQLQVSDADGIAVDFEGTVERVTFGPQGRERNVTPSVLAYLYHNQRLAFLFAAASFVWGALWSLRRLVGA